MFIRISIIPIKKYFISNLYNFFKTTTFICIFFSHPIKFGKKIEFLIFNKIFHDYNKNCAFYQKMVKRKFVDLFKTNNFVP